MENQGTTSIIEGPRGQAERKRGATASGRVTIRLLGLPEISGRAVGSEQPTPVVFHLLAYLLINERNNRTTMCTAFWPEASERQARRRLSTAVWRLRKYFESLSCTDPHPIVAAGDRLAFNANDPFWADITAFDSIVGRVVDGRNHHADAIADLERAVELYRGDLLEGCYEEWLLADRERYRQRLVSGLEHLADWHHRNGNPERAVHYGQRLLDLDPLRESVHRAIMQIHLDRGQPNEALRQFEACRQILDAELQAPPMPETVLMAAAIRRPNEPPAGLGSSTEASASTTSAFGEAERPDPGQAIDCLRQARDQADVLSRTLTEALRALEHLDLRLR